MMATGTQNELSGFHDFPSRKLTSGAVQLSPQEALDLWREEHPGTDDFSNNVGVLREALADMEAGDHGLPLDEFDCKFRQRHSVPPGT